MGSAWCHVCSSPEAGSAQNPQPLLGCDISLAVQAVSELPWMWSRTSLPAPAFEFWQEAKGEPFTNPGGQGMESGKIKKSRWGRETSQMGEGKASHFSFYRLWKWLSALIFSELGNKRERTNFYKWKEWKCCFTMKLYHELPTIWLTITCPTPTPAGSKVVYKKISSKGHTGGPSLLACWSISGFYKNSSPGPCGIYLPLSQSQCPFLNIC